jgi:mannose-6-phosphate isomerase-like protein (cupin superfamily)
MKIYRFDAAVGRKIEAFDSVNFIMAKVARLTAETRVSCAYLGPGGSIGYHQAVVDQLMLIVQGEGWVRGETTERLPVTVGHAVYWPQGEWHETTTDAGVMAMVIESEALNPAEMMPPVETANRS